MTKRSAVLGPVALGVVLAGLALRATTIHSLGVQPFIYRVESVVNDLDSVEGLAPPGSRVELWVKQRNFREGDDTTGDPFSWCQWKNNGVPILVGVTTTGAKGVWRLTNLRSSGNTVMVLPAGPDGDACRGGIYTELLPTACQNGVCSDWASPRLHWLNVRKLSALTGAVTGSVSAAEQTAAAVADGPNDGTEPSDVVDVDQNGVDTTTAGYTPGQRVTWRCGAGGTVGCPSIAVHDASTVIAPDPEFPYLLGSIQGHRPGGSFIAAAAIPRGSPIGFAVNVKVRFRGRLDLNLGCDQKTPFDFLAPPLP